MDKLTFKETLIVEDRRKDLNYTEKKVKGEIDRVIVELNGNESGVFTKLAGRYDRLDKAIKLMGQKKNELNAEIKAKAEELFAAEDIVLTRVVETVSFTMTVSKRSKTPDKTTIDFKGIAEELAKLIPDELQSKVDEIVKAYTTIAAQPDKSPALSVKSKVTEGILQDLGSNLVSTIKRLLKNVSSWAITYDRKLVKLKKQLG